MINLDRLAEMRLNKKFTHQNMADKLGITRQAYGNYESGKRDMDTETLAKIADILETNSDYLLGRTNNSSSDPAALYIAAMERSKQGDSVAEQTAAGEPEDPKISRFFKDFKSAPAEKQEEAIRFWEFIKQQEKDRKPGDKQGE